MPLHVYGVNIFPLQYSVIWERRVTVNSTKSDETLHSHLSPKKAGFTKLKWDKIMLRVVIRPTISFLRFFNSTVQFPYPSEQN